MENYELRHTNSTAPPVQINYERAYHELEVTVQLLQGRVERRNEALRDLRRKVLIDILQYKLGGDHRTDVQQAVAEDMQCDDITILELREEIEQWSAKVKQRDHEIDILRRKLTSEYQRSKAFVINQEKASFVVDEKLRQYELEKKAKQTLLNSKEATIERQLHTISSLEDTVSNLEKEHIRLLGVCQSHQHSITEQEETIRVLQNEIGTMRGTIAEKNKTIKEMTIEGNILKNRNVKLQTQIEDLQARNDKLLQQLDDLISRGAVPSITPATPPVSTSSRRPSSAQSNTPTPPRRASTRITKPTTITRSRLSSISSNNGSFRTSIPEEAPEEDQPVEVPVPVAPASAPQAPTHRAPRLSVYTLSPGAMEELTSPKQQKIRRMSQRFVTSEAGEVRPNVQVASTQTDEGSTDSSMKSLSALFATKDKEISDLKLKVASLQEDIEDTAYANLSTENTELRTESELSTITKSQPPILSDINDDIDTSVEIVQELVEFKPAVERPPLLSRRVSSLNEAAMIELRKTSTVGVIAEDDDEDKDETLKPYLGIRREHDWNIELFVYKNCKYTQCEVPVTDASCQVEEDRHVASPLRRSNSNRSPHMWSVATQTKRYGGDAALPSDEYLLERLFKDIVDVCKHFQDRYLRPIENIATQTNYLEDIMKSCDSSVWMDDHLKECLNEELRHAVTHRRRIDTAISLLSSLFLLHGDFVDEVTQRHESSATSRLLVRCLEAILYTLDKTLDPKPVPVNQPMLNSNDTKDSFAQADEILSDEILRISPPRVTAWNNSAKGDLTLSDACIDIIESYVPARAVYTENKVLFTRPPPLELRQRPRDILGGGSPKGVLTRSRETSPARRSRNSSPESSSPRQFRTPAESPRERGVFTIDEDISYQDIVDMSSPTNDSAFRQTDSALPRREDGNNSFVLISTRLQPRRNVSSR